MTTTPTLYACRVHPNVRAELHVRGSALCTLCGKPLRRVETPAEETPLSRESEKENPRVQ